MNSNKIDIALKKDVKILNIYLNKNHLAKLVNALVSKISIIYIYDGSSPSMIKKKEWLSGLKRQFAKLLYIFFCTVGSNPTSFMGHSVMVTYLVWIQANIGSNPVVPRVNKKIKLFYYYLNIDSSMG